ncbi:MAG: PrsW family intramembrane metalloprotease [Ruminococcaceae bacterium]|nr:PrsW family intramembrane metalloprotease [Oscillospiraceae bacterium]
MGLNEILLIAAALLPAIVLLVYIYIKDRVEKEPLRLLLLLLFAGVVIIIPILLFEILFGAIIDTSFGLVDLAEDADIASLLGPVNFRIYTAITMFIGVALVEEFFKWLAMNLITRKNKNFNSLFDGLVYAIFVSLGFAAIENVLYVLQNGWINAIMRAIMSVPGHMFFAVMMGYFYSLWHMNDKARSLEAKFKEMGVIRPMFSAFGSGAYRLRSIVVPVLMHGFYNYCCSVGSILETLLLIALVILFYIFSFKKIKKVSSDDASDIVYAVRMLHKKYPGIAAWAEENPDLYNSVIAESL